MAVLPVFLSGIWAAPSAVAQFLCPGTELVFEGEVVAASHGLE
jgi:hypothetical protein